ncbi:MAG TPA: hypothetical protein VFG20_00425 [Planctomycetaceae bacterium]|nr:hypothetical protein [Planctomycetaceae bacterium]
MPESHEAPQWAVISLCLILIAIGLYFRHYEREGFRRLPKSDVSIRLMGLSFTILGPLTFFVVAYKPMQDALHHKPKVAVPAVAIFGAAIFVYMGLVMLLTGSWFYRLRASGQHRRVEKLGRMMLIGGAVFCVAVVVGFFYALRTLGYG